MARYKNIILFENIYRRKELEKFRSDIEAYFNNIECSYGSFHHILNEISKNKKKEINLKLNRLEKYITDTGTSINIYYQSNVRGVAGNINMLENISESYSYQFNDQMYFDIIDKTIGIYKDDFINSIIRTFNPLFRLNKIITLIALIPFYVLGYSGFNINKKSYQDSMPIKIFKLIFTIISIFAGVITIFTWLGITKENLINYFTI